MKFLTVTLRVFCALSFLSLLGYAFADLTWWVPAERYSFRECLIAMFHMIGLLACPGFEAVKRA